MQTCPTLRSFLMRIISGTHKGATISAPRGGKTRPTADRVREAIFSMLGDVSGLSVLDLFAGSGALAFEALSRGAADALLADSRIEAVRAATRNREKLGLEQAEVRRRDYLAVLKEAVRKGRRFDLIFVDPPYKIHRILEPELSRWLPEVCAPGGRVVVESDVRQDISLPFSLAADKRYGDTRVYIFIASGRQG